MSATFLTHIDCGGDVVLDATKTTKLVAPSFAINAGGISNLTLDIRVMDGGVLDPAFLCIHCNVEIDRENISSQLAAHCQVCSGLFPVQVLHVHSEIVCLCTTCKNKLDAYALNNEEDVEEIIKDYSEQFGLSRKLKTVSLEKVLTSPITI